MFLACLSRTNLSCSFWKSPRMVWGQGDKSQVIPPIITKKTTANKQKSKDTQRALTLSINSFSLPSSTLSLRLCAVSATDSVSFSQALLAKLNMEPARGEKRSNVFQLISSLQENKRAHKRTWEQNVKAHPVLLWANLPLKLWVFWSSWDSSVSFSATFVCFSTSYSNGLLSLLFSPTTRCRFSLTWSFSFSQFFSISLNWRLTTTINSLWDKLVVTLLVPLLEADCVWPRTYFRETGGNVTCMAGRCWYIILLL